MDSETIYILVGVVLFGIGAYFLLRDTTVAQFQTEDEKRYAILNAYAQELRETLKPLANDRDAYTLKKRELLMKFNSELSRNIFFQPSEIKEILVDLSQKA